MAEQDGATGPDDGAGGKDLGQQEKVGQVHVITLEDGWPEGRETQGKVWRQRWPRGGQREAPWPA